MALRGLNQARTEASSTDQHDDGMADLDPRHLGQGGHLESLQLAQNPDVHLVRTPSNLADQHDPLAAHSDDVDLLTRALVRSAQLVE